MWQTTPETPFHSEIIRFSFLLHCKQWTMYDVRGWLLTERNEQDLNLVDLVLSLSSVEIQKHFSWMRMSPCRTSADKQRTDEHCEIMQSDNNDAVAVFNCCTKSIKGRTAWSREMRNKRNNCKSSWMHYHAHPRYTSWTPTWWLWKCTETRIKTTFH